MSLMGSLQVAIPSYQRPQTLRKKTLAWLYEGGHLRPSQVTLFVADRVEYESYAPLLADGLVGRIVVAVPGMGAVRRFISHFYREGERLLQVDDDLTRLVCAAGGKLVPFTDLTALLVHGFGECERVGARLWGIYPCPNARWLSPTTTFDLRYIVGAFFGVVNSYDPALQVTLDDKEDVERTLKHYVADGVVVRVNDVAPVTRYYSEPGGMQESSGVPHPSPRTKERVLKSAIQLCERYPGLCTLNQSKRSGWAEVRLQDRRVPRANSSR